MDTTPEFHISLGRNNQMEVLSISIDAAPVRTLSVDYHYHQMLLGIDLRNLWHLMFCDIEY